MAKQNKRDSVSSSNALKLKIDDIRKTIRNKFKKACANRLECERDSTHAMKPLAASETSIQQQLCAKSSSKSRMIERNDTNYLCTRLKVLLSSNEMFDEVQRTRELNAIINRLRDLKIIV